MKEGNSIFDISVINKRYFDIKIGDLSLRVGPPKNKVLKKIMVETDSAEAVRLIVNKNETDYVVPYELLDELDSDQLDEIIVAFFTWLKGVKNSPNS